MFEKEAEEYQIRKHHQRLYGHKPVVMKELNTTYKDGFKDGYNKANEWHEGLPTEDVKLAIIEVKDCGYLLCECRKGVLYNHGSSAVCKDWITRNIKRWKEIVLSELPKESE